LKQTLPQALVYRGFVTEDALGAGDAMSNGLIHYHEMAARAPLEVARRLKRHAHLAYLDSGKDPEGLGRYSYVAADPFGVFRVIKGRAYWNESALDAPPFEAFRSLLERYQRPIWADLPPFQTGVIGFLSYEAARLMEAVPCMVEPDDHMPDIEFGFYDVVFAHDHAENRSFILSSGWPEQDPSARDQRAKARIAWLLDVLDEPMPAEALNPAITEWQFDMDQARFEAAVQGTIERILNGDLFQANLAQRFLAKLPAGFDPLVFYANLRRMSPSSFGAYLNFGDISLASNSPERFLTLKNRRIEARPIKGTAPRGATPEADKALAQGLKDSVKDRAENTMIVDLLRNDLSRVAEPFSVKVPILCGLETYASMHHLVSVVEATLAANYDGLDLIMAAFPCGSISGAPKLKAMGVIGEIEGVSRGVYCGSIGYIGVDGTMDLNVAIRTVTFQTHQARFHAGGGITALSHPSEEYQETLVKAERIFRAFRLPLSEEET
jgi:para-aminobenzoate synthetase component 1